MKSPLPVFLLTGLMLLAGAGLPRPVSHFAAWSAQAATTQSERAEAANNPWLYIKLGEAYNNLKGDATHDALKAYTKALQLFEKAGNLEGQRVALRELGFTYDVAGNVDAALESYQKSLILARQLGDLRAQGGIMIDIGGIGERQQQFDQAIAAFQTAQTDFQKAGDRTWEARALVLSGMAYIRHKQLNLALNHYQQALTIVLALPGSHTTWVATLQSQLGDLYYDQQQPSQALAAYQQALALFQKAGDHQGEQKVRLAIAKLQPST